MTEKPFLIEPKDLMGQKKAREVGEQKGRLFYLNVEDIRIRPGFNYRQNFLNIPENEWEAEIQIPELAGGLLLSNGPDEPLQGDLLKEDRKFYITDGERRYRAINHLLREGHTHYANGRGIAMVEVLLNNEETTELDRIRKIYTTGTGKLIITPRQLALGWLHTKDEFNLSNEEMAATFNCSRQKVDMYIKAAEKFTGETWAKIENGDTSLSKEIGLLRDSNKPNLAMVDLETGELADQTINTIPELTAPSEEVDRLDQERVKHETIEAHNKEQESRITDPKAKPERRTKEDGDDALGKVNDDDQVIDGVMDIEQAIRKLDKLNIMVGKLPPLYKQAETDMCGLIEFTQRLIQHGLEKIKTAASSK